MRPLELVELEIWNLIREKELLPGKRIKEVPLKKKIFEATNVDVSQTVIREVLQKMALQGIVNSIPYKGATLVELNEEDIKKIVDVRMQLEPHALNVGKKILKKDKKRKQKIISYLEKNIEIMRDSVGKKDSLNPYMETHQDFHRIIWSCADNYYLERTLDNLTNALFQYYRIITAQGEKVPNDTFKAHLDFLNFFKIEKYEKSATEIVKEHLKRIE